MPNPTSVSPRRSRFPLPTLLYLSAALAVVVTGCGDEAVEPNAAPEGSASASEEAEFRVGVTVDTPGLVTGNDTSSLSGLEVDVVQYLFEQLDVDNTAVEWVPVTPEQPSAAVIDGAVDLALARGDVAVGSAESAESEDPEDSAAVAGQYLHTTPAMLVHSEDADAVPGDGTQPPIDDLTDLGDAAVCLVEGSSTELLDLPEAAEPERTTTQPSATECGVGLLSGRFQAVVADQVQLAGMLTDPRFTDQTQLRTWDELAPESSTAPAIPYQVLVPPGSDHCTAVAEALSDTDAVDDVLAGTGSELAPEPVTENTSSC